MVTGPLTGAEVGDRVFRTGVTENDTPLLASPPTVTTTFPVVAKDGTETTMAPPTQLVAVAVAPLKVTVLEPWLAPKFDPETVIELPVGPEVADNPVILGGGVTVKGLPALDVPFTVTITFPVVAPGGTIALILVGVQVGIFIAEIPLKVTVLLVAPKPVPAIVTEAPIAPEAGERLVMSGVTEKGTPLLLTPFT